jgi:hypothetical protein
MNNEQLNAIRQRAEKATPGPWRVSGGEIVSKTILDRKYGQPEVVAEVIYEQEADATFIAHARQDVPALLDEIVYLNGVIGTLVGFFEVARDYPKVTATIIEEALKYGEEELRR